MKPNDSIYTCPVFRSSIPRQDLSLSLAWQGVCGDKVQAWMGMQGLPAGRQAQPALEATKRGSNRVIDKMNDASKFV